VVLPHALPMPPPSLKLTSIAHLRFLLIEDDVAQLNVTKAILASAGATEIVAVSSGEDAARELASGKAKIDCVICDYRLGDLSGLGLLHHIRSGKNPFIPRDLKFVMATGYGDAALVKSCMSLDINGFVAKPITVGSLLKAVQGAMAKNPTLKSGKDYAALAIDLS
jgi:CheY-like chemotaxis protein